jgi:hypothetical protein
MDKLAVHPVTPRPDGHFERVERQLGPERIGNLPADNHPGKQVEDERGINKVGASFYIGNVSYPATVRRRCGEVAFQQVRRPPLTSRATLNNIASTSAGPVDNGAGAVTILAHTRSVTVTLAHAPAAS